MREIYCKLRYDEKQIFMKAAMRSCHRKITIVKACEILVLNYGTVLNWLSSTKRIMLTDRFTKIEAFYFANVFPKCSARQTQKIVSLFEEYREELENGNG